MRDKKILLVTGASSELGIEIIKQLYDEYYLILAHYNESFQQLVELEKNNKNKLLLFQADFSCQDSVKKLANDIINSGICPDHIIHLSAPKFRIQKFHKESLESINENYIVSVEAIITLLQEFLPRMAKQRYGKVVFALSKNVVGFPAKYQSAYTVGKYALLGLMKSLAVEYADKGISINAVSPDMIETKFLSDIPSIIINEHANKMPRGRNLTVEDVVPTFLYLLSDASDSISGENIVVSGGNTV